MKIVHFIIIVNFNLLFNCFSSNVDIITLPSNVKRIVGLTDDNSYLPRVQAIHALGKNLPQDQIDAFYEFLFQKLEDQELPDLEFNGLKNELTWALIWQERVPKELAKHLDTMFRDKSYDVTWRDYCVQFFGKYYRYVGEADRKILKAGLEEALNEWQNRIAGTAGYMLWQMSDYPGFDKQAIIDRIVEVLNQPDCSNASKLPLLQACGGAGDKRALPQARDDKPQTRNPENRLIKAEKGMMKLEFDYDYMGRRIFKKIYNNNVLISHIRFVYDEHKLIQELDALNNNLLRSYVWQPSENGMNVPLSIFDSVSNQTYYYNLDGNKNVSDLLNSSGTLVAHYEYTPFGVQTLVSGAYTQNPIRFSSEYFDTETGLYYYNYRYYNSELGRWLSRDPIGEIGGINLYQMCKNNTICIFDLNGLFTPIIGAFWGGVSGGVSGAIIGGITGGWKGAFIGFGTGVLGGVVTGGLIGAGIPIMIAGPAGSAVATIGTQLWDTGSIDWRKVGIGAGAAFAGSAITACYTSVAYKCVHSVVGGIIDGAAGVYFGATSSALVDAYDDFNDWIDEPSDSRIYTPGDIYRILK